MSDSFKILSPDGAIEPTGTWSLGTRAGDFVFIAGMRGIDPQSNELVEGMPPVFVKHIRTWNLSQNPRGPRSLMQFD